MSFSGKPNWQRLLPFVFFECLSIVVAFFAGWFSIGITGIIGCVIDCGRGYEKLGISNNLVMFGGAGLAGIVVFGILTKLTLKKFFPREPE